MPDADSYVQFQFNELAINAGDSYAFSWQLNVSTVGGTIPNYTQTNDYSFDGTITVAKDWTKVTLADDHGSVVWGVAP
jgi:hypothetical protein